MRTRAKSATPRRRSAPAALRRRGLTAWISLVAPLALVMAPGRADAQGPRRDKSSDLERALASTRDIESTIVEAERAAAKKEKATAEQLARRLVEGQLMLAERDVERAAIVFLDLIENHRGSPAAAQAWHYLGKALTFMGMEQWAAECYSANLADRTPDGRRHHQASIAGLLGLAAPSREPGFARRPGLSAMPELRARLQAVGLEVGQDPPAGVLDEADAERVLNWARSVPAADRSAELRYAMARYMFLRGAPAQARDEVDALIPPDESIDGLRPESEYFARGLYVGAAATLAMDEPEEALGRFARVTSVVPRTDEERQIVELAWMAQGRILHDLEQPDEAVEKYKQISRDSSYFPEAMYETAWTLLRAEDYEQAIQALDLLLIYDPDSPIVAEIKQLRGKVKIQQRDYAGAEQEFLALRKEFDELRRRIGRQLEGKSTSATYFSAVVAEDMQHFTLDALVPVPAVPVARTLPRTVQTETVANEVGELQQELFETRALLAKMEEAVRAPERARLFQDLAAYLASVDGASVDLVDVEESLIARLRTQNNTPRAQLLETKRKQLRAKMDRPVAGATRGQVTARIADLAELAHKAELQIAALRAQLVGTERYYEQTRRQQKIDHEKHMETTAAMRDEIGALERDVETTQAEIEKLSTALRFEDPWMQAQRRAIAEYDAYLDAMYAELSKAAKDGQSDALYARVGQLQARTVSARRGLDRAAGFRLARAIQILTEERANLDRYLVELGGYTEDTRVLAGEVMQASFHDVMAEVSNLVTRSEVGLLDVAWAVQAAEAEEIQRLETERARDLKEVDRVLEEALEAVE